jgi:hypothetical protein
MLAVASTGTGNPRPGTTGAPASRATTAMNVDLGQFYVPQRHIHQWHRGAYACPRSAAPRLPSVYLLVRARARAGRIGRARKLGFRGETMPMGGDQVRRSPAHAGRLRPWERFTIALALVLMAAIVALVLL